MQCKGEGSPNGRKRKRKNDYRAGGGGAGRFKNNGVPRTFRERAHQRENPRQGVRLYGACPHRACVCAKDPKVRTNNIAMVVPQRFITLDLPFLRKCMGGICTMADQRGYDMLLCYASSTEYTQLQRQLASHKVDGVILTYAMADDPCVDLLRQYDVPFVLIGRSEDKTIPQADNDQVAAACEMTRILLQMGAKRIALLVGSTIYAVNTDRTRGYLRGFAESCVPVDQRLVHSGIESTGQTIDALEAALEQKADCLLCGDDEIAYEVMRELRNRHILVPHDLRVASLYDSSMLASITPSVSAVQYDAEQLGRTACRMLLDRLLGKEMVQRQIEGYQVILRESTKWNSRTHDGR